MSGLLKVLFSHLASRFLLKKKKTKTESLSPPGGIVHNNFSLHSIQSVFFLPLILLGC